MLDVVASKDVTRLRNFRTSCSVRSLELSDHCRTSRGERSNPRRVGQGLEFNKGAWACAMRHFRLKLTVEKSSEQSSVHWKVYQVYNFLLERLPAAGIRSMCSWLHVFNERSASVTSICLLYYIPIPKYECIKAERIKSKGKTNNEQRSTLIRSL